MKPMMKQLAAALTLLAANAYAEDPTWFEVELLVFTQAGSTSEQFSDQQQPVDTRNGVDLFSQVWMPDISPLQLALTGCSSEQWMLTPDECQLQEFLPEEPEAPAQLPMMAAASEQGDPLLGSTYLLEQEQLQFADQSRQLRRNGSTILLHSGWQMPVYGKRQAKAFRLFGGKNYQAQFNLDGSLKQQTENPFAEYSWLDNGEQQTKAPPVWQLDGLLTIYLNHFLFIDADLGLRQPAEREVEQIEVSENVEETASPGIEIYSLETQPEVTENVLTEPYLATIPLVQSRRVRSREIHYFDHPKFGMVIQIRRMEQPKAPAAVEPQPAPTTTLR